MSKKKRKQPQKECMTKSKKLEIDYAHIVEYAFIEEKDISKEENVAILKSIEKAMRKQVKKKEI